MAQTIQPINHARMANKVHAQFHENVFTLVETATPQALAIEDLYALYRKAFDDELVSLNIILKSELSVKISEQDSVRDRIFRGLSDTVKGFRNHFDPDFREAANRLWNVLLHYGNIARLSLDAQTAAVSDILREFQTPANQKSIEKLRIQDWCDKLDEENRKFHELMIQRYSETAGRTTLRMKTSRLEVDKIYRAIVADLENKALTGKTNQAIDTFMAELNAVVKRFKNILAQQFGKKKATGEGKVDN